MIFLSAFIVTFLSMRPLINRLKIRNLTGKDMNKQGKQEIPELGGIGVWLGFSFGIMASIFLYSYLNFFRLDLSVLLAAFTTVIMVGFIGLIDDLIGWKVGIKQWQHALLPVFAALPLMAVSISNPPTQIPFLGFAPSEIFIPLLGLVSFTVIYSLFYIPVGITGAANAANMLAGFNGLEAGMGILISLTLAVISLLLGKPEPLILSIALLGALSAFILFNWFPAKVFGGDTLTLMIGATIAAAVIIGDMEKIGIALFALYFIEFLIKAKHKFKSECFGIPQKDGTLKANPKGGSITHLIMRLGRFTEQQVTLLILGLQALVCISVFYMFLNGFAVI